MTEEAIEIEGVDGVGRAEDIVDQVEDAMHESLIPKPASLRRRPSSLRSISMRSESDNENGLDVDEDLTSPGFMSSSLPALPTHSHARPDPDPCPDMIAIIDHSDPSFSDPTGAGEPFAQHVTLTDPQIVGGKYVAYLCTVTTPQGTEIQCRKRYSEFRALEGMLKVSYPVIVRSLPRFPGKSVVQKFRAEFVDRRRRRLEFWLSCVLLHPNLGGSTVVRKWWTEQVE